MTTLLYAYDNVVATRYLGRAPYPFDITLLPSLVPGMILQADFHAGDPDSRIRNRVGASMSVVGSPTLGTYGITLNEANHIDTGLDVASYNDSDMTMISILNWPGAVSSVMGRVQINAPQRTRGIQTSSASWVGKWLTAAGAAQQAAVTANTPAGMSEMVAARFVRDNGSGSMLTKLKIPRMVQEVTTTAAAAPYPMQATNMVLGASVDGATTGSIFMRAALMFNRAITDAELATVYTYYQNYFALKNISI
ncbi:hypothetical protein [Klebsiella aerogenes]|uniref:hypothetical protein n=1 Tax=Klebsiella aerogenes TaxID=548 RepID=UPI0011ED0CDA|nr:hypothetical protein [Klebsiella aerogenes]KAA0472854.1 hypothetical protein F0333_03090 [Klebsiella aerogenes]